MVCEQDGALDLTLALDDGVLEFVQNEVGMVRCVFSSMELMRVGTGTTTKKHASKLYWFVEEIKGRRFAIRQINVRHLPVGNEKIIELDELMSKYLPEVEFFEEKTIPAMELLEEYLDDGEEDRAEGRLYSAESHFNKALVMDERNVRALFNLGLIYLEQKDVDKAKDMMGDLLNVKSAFDGKNQHLFNEFGISLRKSGLFDEAVRYYTRALEFVKMDENLYYNLARANYERSNWEECVEAIYKVFELNPQLEACHELIGIIRTLVNRPQLGDMNNKERVPRDIVGRINGLFEKHPEHDMRKTKRPADPLQFSHDGEKPEGGRARSGGKSESSGGGLRFDME